MADMPYLRHLRFTRAIDQPRAKLALSMLLRMDEDTGATFDRAGRITGVFSGRDYSGDVAYVAGKFAHSNPVNVGYSKPANAASVRDE